MSVGSVCVLGKPWLELLAERFLVVYLCQDSSVLRFIVSARPPQISLSPQKDASAKPTTTNAQRNSNRAAPTPTANGHFPLPRPRPRAAHLPPTSSPSPLPLPPLCVSPRRQTPPPPSPLPPPPSVSSAARQSWSSASPGVARWRRRVPGGVCDGADPRRHESGFCVGGERDGESVTRTGEAWGETR